MASSKLTFSLSFCFKVPSLALLSLPASASSSGLFAHFSSKATFFQPKPQHALGGLESFPKDFLELAQGTFGILKTLFGAYVGGECLKMS